ncbi:MAG: cytochrome c [Bacteroidota bacterium]
MKNTLSIILILTLACAIISCGGKESAPTTSSAGKVTADATSSQSSKKVAASSSANRKGKLIYKQYCTVCHGADGKLAVSGAKDLSMSKISLEERINQVTNGKGLMTPYKDILSEDQIKSVCLYIEELRQ